MKQGNKMWEEKSLNSTSLHMELERNTPIITLSSVSKLLPGITAPLRNQLVQGSLGKQCTGGMSVFYGSSKNQYIINFKAGRVLIAKHASNGECSIREQTWVSWVDISFAVINYIWFSNCTPDLCLTFKKQTAGNRVQCVWVWSTVYLITPFPLPSPVYSF